MKKITTLILIVFGLFTLMACKNNTNDDVFVDIKYDLYEFPFATEQEALAYPELFVGQRYVLYFDIDFANFQNTLKGKFPCFNGKVFCFGKEEIAHVKITVSLGAIDDQEINLINSTNIPDGGFPYEPMGDGKWEATFVITKTKTVDFSKTPFNIWIDSVGLINMNNQTVRVSMTTNDRTIFLGSSKTYAITLFLQPGNFLFTKEDHITHFLNYTGTLMIPSEATQVTFTYYSDNTKSVTLGSISYTNNQNNINFDYAEHIARLFYGVEVPTLQQVLNIRNRILNKEFDNYFVKVQADGGQNFNTQYFEFHPFRIEG
jgi:hypothetical protein